MNVSISQLAETCDLLTIEFNSNSEPENSLLLERIRGIAGVREANYEFLTIHNQASAYVERDKAKAVISEIENIPGVDQVENFTKKLKILDALRTARLSNEIH